MGTEVRSVAFFDLDKTIYNDHSFFGATKYLVDQGVIQTSAYDGVMEELRKHRKEGQSYIESANNMLNILARSLVGVDYARTTELMDEYFRLNKDNFYPYFAQVLPEIRKTHDVVLVTTNTQMAAGAAAAMFSLDKYICTEFEVKDGKFTGNVMQSLAGGKGIVEEMLAEYGGETLAFGDSENDIEMLRLVKHAVCVNPSPELAVEANTRGWLTVTDSDAAERILELLNKIHTVESA